jgi:hypothetical protein
MPEVTPSIWMKMQGAAHQKRTPVGTIELEAGRRIELAQVAAAHRLRGVSKGFGHLLNLMGTVPHFDGSHR